MSSEVAFEKPSLWVSLTRAVRPWQLVLLLSLSFALAYSQQPLFSPNQNTYLLHGLARAGYGTLAQDWLAGTTDPTPLFSAFVALTARLLDARLVQVYGAVLMGVYLWGLLGISSCMQPRPPTALYIAALFVLHSNWLADTSKGAWGWDARELLWDGVAGQYAVGSAFQPSMFGVLLVASIAAFLRERYWLSTILLVVAAAMHPTYLLSAGLLAGAYMGVRFAQDRDARGAWGIGAMAALGLAPVALYVFSHFGPTSHTQYYQAKEILATLRIPHHALPQVWFDWTACVKVGLVVAALYLSRRSRLFWVLLLPFVAACLLTAVQVATGSYALALVFPWRPSVFIVPVATAVVLGRLLALVAPSVQRLSVRWQSALSVCSLLVVVGCAAAGAQNTVTQAAEQAEHTHTPMQTFVERNKSVGQVYLVPPEWQTFRLDTGAAIFVDWKSHPYKDAEVLEWYERVQLAQQFYEYRDGLDVESLRAICQRGGVTHVVLPTWRSGALPEQLVEVHRDSAYGVYRVVG
ncbi:MAG: hypothetical protein GX552_11330 [Chloroflexi bacterium]|nr:hypothetical protein [Chloroflexota bacterium]